MVGPVVNPAQTVQLLHELPDGSRHIDWLIDLDPVHEGRLLTFRLDRRVDELSPGDRMTGVRLADHRRTYLTYEGPVAGDRGRVTRVAAGRIAAVQSLGEQFALVIGWRSTATPRSQRVRVCPRADGEWLVEALALG